jgi:N-acyl-D-aspartate/D-glutamate deacylase
VSFDASLAGKTLADYLVATGQPVTLEAAVEALIALQLRGGFIGIFHGMDEADVARFLTHPGTMVETDGDLVTFGRGFPHPRSYGSFPRVLAHHVRERQQLTLEAAVQRMTALPAQWLGIRDRGTLAVGQRADITVFNAGQIADRATYTAPHQWPEGIQLVAVNGTVVFENGRMTGALPGMFLTRGRGAR